ADYDKNELETQLCQKPVWEYDDINEYIQQRLSGMFPDNLAELYTVWSRMLHIEWKNEQPTIFSAGLPKLDNKNIFLEPMTTWRKN
ncbi:type I-E CRISPR-associated protein Cse1/CasA, partial [Streptomyces scabiei]